VQITKTVAPWQRRKLLTKYCELFSSRFAATDRRTEIWKEIISSRESLDSKDRDVVVTDLASRYSMQPNGEIEVLGLLEYISKDLASRKWSVSDSLLASIANRATFDGSEIDKQRLAVLTAFRHVQSRHVLRTVLAKIAALLLPIGAKASSSLAVQIAMSTLFDYESSLIGPEASTEIVGRLVDQARQSPVVDRPWWLTGLLHLYPVLDDAKRAEVKELFKSTFVDADPSKTLEFMSLMGADSIRNMFSISDFIDVLRIQVQLFGAVCCQRQSSQTNNSRQVRSNRPPEQSWRIRLKPFMGSRTVCGNRNKSFERGKNSA
jgi:hypothetical protein